MPEMRGPQKAPTEQKPVYKPGDVVWVKLQAFPWWPAQVVPAEEYPDLKEQQLQSMVALIKTFQDNCVIPITKANKIALFEDPRKEDWIKRGQFERRSTLQSMFLPAVRQAEEELQEAKTVNREEEMEDQESKGACENCSGVSVSPSIVETVPKRPRRGSGRSEGRKRPRRKSSRGRVHQNKCTSELLPPPSPPLPPSPPQSDKEFVRHETYMIDFDDLLPRIAPPTKSPHWSKKPQKPELETVGVKEPVSEKDSMETNDQENRGAECVETSSRADQCDGTAVVSDPATAESIGRSECPTQVLSEFQDEKAAARDGDSVLSEPGCDSVTEEALDSGGQGVESCSLSEASSDILPLPVTPVKSASPYFPPESMCSPVMSNCSEGMPFPFSPEKEDEDDNVNDEVAPKSPSLFSFSSFSDNITSPNLDKGLQCSSNKTDASSSEATVGDKCVSTCSTRARHKRLSGNAGKAEEACTLESVEALTPSAQTTSIQEERSPVQDPEETLLGPADNDEPVCESQSLPLPVTPEKRKRGKSGSHRRVTKKARPCKEAKVETNPVEAEGSRACPVVTTSSSVVDKTEGRGKGCSNADSDSESDLPDVLKLSPDEMKYPQENSLVWVKFQRFPFWPSLVGKVLKIRNRIKKIRVTFLGEGPRSFNINYTRTNVIYPFAGPHQQKLVDDGREALKDKSEALKNFNNAVHLAYQHRSAEMLKAFSCTELEPMDTGVMEDPPAKTGASSKQDKKRAAKRNAPSRRTKTSPRPAFLQKKITLQKKVGTDRQTTRARVSKPSSRAQQEKRLKSMMLRRQQNLKKLFALKEMRKKRNKKIVEYIKSEAAAEYLKNVFHGKTYSERHAQYLRSIRERDKLRYAGFGPIDDEEQQQDILYHLTRLFKECHQKLGDETYVLDVWVPEAVVLGLQKTRRQAPKKAWDIFFKGLPMLKVEQELLHEEISANIKRLKSEDQSTADAAVKAPDV